MTTGMMNTERLRELVAMYGADPGRWPSQERTAAQDLLHQHPELQAECEAQAALDAALEEYVAPAVPSSLSARIMQGFVEMRPEDREFSLQQLLQLLFGGRERAPAFAMASMVILLAIGGLGGVAGGALTSHEASDTAILSQAFDTGGGLGSTLLEQSS